MGGKLRDEFKRSINSPIATLHEQWMNELMNLLASFDLLADKSHARVRVSYIKLTIVLVGILNL